MSLYDRYEAGNLSAWIKEAVQRSFIAPEVTSVRGEKM